MLATIDGATVEVGGPGCDVWARLGTWVTEEELTAELVRQYGADERDVAADIRALLTGLHAEGYVDRDG